MGAIIIAGVGAIVGWAASVITRTDTQRGFLFNILVGIAGALLTAWVFDPFFVNGDIMKRGFDLRLLSLSLAGPAIILATVLFLRKRALR